MASQKLKATVTIGGALDGSFKKSIGGLRSRLEGVGSSIKDLERKQAGLAKQRRVWEREGRAVEDLDREYEDLGRTLDQLRRKQERLERAQMASRRVGREWSSFMGSARRTATTAGIAIGAAGAAIVGMSKAVADAGDNAAKTADKLGFTIEGLQEYRYAAERSGVATATFDSSMVALQKRLGEAAQGRGAAVKTLEQLGLAVEDLIAMSPEDQLAAIGDAMSTLQTPAERAAAAAGLFSRAGVGMVNVLRGGSESLEALREDARRTGYVLSEEAARDAEAFTDKMLDFRLSMTGVRNTIGAQLMPVVGRYMDQMAAFIRNNREGIGEFAERLATGLNDALPQLIEFGEGLSRVAGTIGRVVGKMADLVGGYDNLAVVVGTLMAGGLIVKTAKLIGSLGSLAFAMGGVGRELVGLRSGLGRAARQSGRTADSIEASAKRIGSARSRIMGKAALGAVGTGLAVASMPDVADVEALAKAQERNRGAILGVADALGLLKLQDWLNSFPKPAWITRVGDALTSAEASASEFLTTLGNTGGIGEAWESLAAGMQSVISRIGGWLDGLAERAGTAVRSLLNVGSSGGETSSGTKGRRERRAQGRAVGGTFKPGLLVVGERGPEAEFADRSGFISTARETERLARLASGAKADAREAVAGAMGGGGRSVIQNITVNAAGASAREVVAEIERMARRAGGGLYDTPRGFGQYEGG